MNEEHNTRAGSQLKAIKNWKTCPDLEEGTVSGAIPELYKRGIILIEFCNKQLVARSCQSIARSRTGELRNLHRSSRRMRTENMSFQVTIERKWNTLIKVTAFFSNKDHVILPC